MSWVSGISLTVSSELDQLMDKFNELEYKFHELDKLNCNFGVLDKLKDMLDELDDLVDKINELNALNCNFDMLDKLKN